MGDDLSDLWVKDASGADVELRAFIGQPLVIVGVRYYGCLPCLEFLGLVRDAYEEIRDVGAEVVAVGTGADYQARHLMDSGTPFRCLVDPEKHLYEALGARRLGARSILDVRNYQNYWHAMRRRQARQGRMTGDHWQLPFVAVLDADGHVRHIHLGQAIGDYPRLDTVLGWLGVPRIGVDVPSAE